MSWIRGYNIPFKSIPVQGIIPKNNTFSDTEIKTISDEVKRLEKLGVISRCKQQEVQFLSKIFTVPKPNGGIRFILNLKCLNKFISMDHFKIEDTRTLCRLLSAGNYMCTIDLKESYFLIPVGEDKRYLRFYFQSNIFEFNALPFGICSAPMTFTKILKPVISLLRSKGFKSVVYLDDIICIGETYDECLENCHTTVTLLECLGFIINREKSILIPSQVTEYLGFIFNTVDMTLCLPDRKKQNTSSLLKKFYDKNKCTIREFSQLIGTLISNCPAVPYGYVYTKILERQKYLALKKYNDDFDSNMEINDECKRDLLWWLNHLEVKNTIKQYRFPMEIFSDASGTGWGIYCNKEVANGFWKEEDKQYHINYLELLAAFLGLKCFAKNKRSCQILLRIDNTTAISYINKMGGIQFPRLNSLSKEIWQWCEARQIWLYASYIKSKENTEADRESRIKNIDCEWELSQNCFQTITSSFGYPSIDLFATRANSKCSRYISWHQDPHAENIDAFTVDWSTYSLCYAFPPFSLLLKTIQKIRYDRAIGILVFPMWTSQPWYPLINEMAISKIVTFKPSKHLLLSPFRTLHPLHNSLSLGACILSGKHTKERRSQMRQLT